MLQRLLVLSAVMLLMTTSLTGKAVSYKAYAKAVLAASEKHFNKKICHPVAEYFVTMQKALNEIAPHQEKVRSFFVSIRHERHHIQKSLLAYCRHADQYTARQLILDFEAFKDALSFNLDKSFAHDDFVHFRQWVTASVTFVDQIAQFAYCMAVRLPDEHQTQLSSLRTEMLFIGFKFLDAFEGALHLPEEDWLDCMNALRDFVVHDQIQYWRSKRSFEEVKDGLERTAFCVYSFIEALDEHYPDLGNDISSITERITQS